MANEIVRYCQAGHAFHIDGNMSVGNTITVTVVPLSGYRFVRWSDGDTNNPRQIYISQCGVSYIGVFEEDTAGDFSDIFNRLSVIIDGSNYSYGYEASSITETDIIDSLNDIIG